MAEVASTASQELCAWRTTRRAKPAAGAEASAGESLTRFPPPIFILGLTRRTGTNFLWDLLRCHPATIDREPIYEDFLLHHADQLASYVEQVSEHWQGVTVPEEARSLLAHLGDGLVSYLYADREGKRLVTKTPSVRNLALFRDLFPRATLLLLVRDGRSVVESAVRSFGTSYAEATRDWVRGAQTVLGFLAAGPPDRCRLVRYEELLTNLDRELTEILEFCELAPGEYDFKLARERPLWGSSTARHSGGELQWKPLSRPADFGGLRRWEAWSGRQHRQFNAAAGRELRQLGYETKE